MILHFSIVVFSALLAWAEPSSTYHPNDIEALRNTPYFQYFEADDKTKLAYSVISDPKATVTKGPLVLVEGKGETAYRYVELAKELQQKGWGPIYILDHRGQGYSEKVLKDSLHVTSFDTYVQDFIKFMDGPVKEDLARRGIQQTPKIVAHSMGGAISNRVLKLRPDLAERIAYVAPMFDINFGKFMERFQNKPMRFLTSTLRRVGLERMRIGASPEKAYGTEGVSTDKARLHTSYDIEREMNIRIPKASVAWVDESLSVGAEIMKPGAQPITPSVIFQGQYDALVNNGALERYACSVDNCTLIELPGAHAMHQEREPVRRTLVDQIDSFLSGKGIQKSGLSCESWYKFLVRVSATSH